MRGTGEGSGSQTRAWAAECSALAEAVKSAGRSSANRVFRKTTSCNILSFGHTSVPAKKLSLAPIVLLSHSHFFSILFLDTLFYFFLFHYFIITDLLSSKVNFLFSFFFLPLVFITRAWSCLFFPLLCLNMFKQHSKWGTTAFAAEAGVEEGSVNCSTSVLTFTSVLYLCSSWTIEYLPCYLFFLCHLKVKIGKLQSMSYDYTTNICNCCS